MYFNNPTGFKKMEHDEMAIVSIFPSTGHRSLRELTLEVTAPDGMARKVFAWGGDTSIDNTEEIVFNAKERLNVNCIYSMSNRSITVRLYVFGSESDGTNTVVDIKRIQFIVAVVVAYLAFLFAYS